MEFSKLVELMETKGAKNLKMLSSTKGVMVKYKTLLMKMAIDGPTNDKAKANFDLFCNVKFLLGFVAIFSLLQLFHNLIKFSKLQDVVICDFMVAKKMC